MNPTKNRAKRPAHPHLTPVTEKSVPPNLGLVKPFTENMSLAVIGDQITENFKIPGDLARQFLKDSNSRGNLNSKIVKPWVNGLELTHRASDTWVIDFVWVPEKMVSHYETPFAYLRENVFNHTTKAVTATSEWWLKPRPNHKMRYALKGLKRFIVTPRISKHRVFLWCKSSVLPDSTVVIISRSDDASMGILQSRFHELWSLRLGSTRGNRHRYYPTISFETFPFPEGLSPDSPSKNCTNPNTKAVANAAKRLYKLRENWLNPPEWIDRVPEVVHGFPDRIQAKPGYEKDLKQRTLTDLYNHCPTWLAKAHMELDKAVAIAYGWNDYTPEMTDKELFQRLFELNCTRIADRYATLIGKAKSLLQPSY